MSLIQDINRTISTAHMQHLAFTVAGRSVTPQVYQPVRTKIGEGVITARKAPNINGVRGAYNYTHNRFDMGFNAVEGDPFRAALVVHEATHAAFDYINQPMSVRVAEALAFVAQALYFWHANREVLEDGGTVTFEEPMATAWTVSEPARSEAHTFTDEELRPLYSAIDAHPDYEDRGDDEEAIDGM